MDQNHTKNLKNLKTKNDDKIEQLGFTRRLYWILERIIPLLYLQTDIDKIIPHNRIEK